MKMFHPSRDKARAAAKRVGRKWVDCGQESPKGRRWAVDFNQKVGGK